MARGEARAQEGGATHEPRSPRSPRATGRPPRPVPVPTARRPVASYLGGGGGRAPGCGLRRSGGGRERAGEGPGRAGAGARGSRGAGSPGTAARRPAAPPHLQLRRGRWPRRPGRAGMSCRGRAEGGGRRREEGPAGRGGGGGGGARGAAALPPPSLAVSLPPSQQTPLSAAAPGPGRQLPGGACASGGGGCRAPALGRGRGRWRVGGGRQRAPGGREGAPSRGRAARFSLDPVFGSPPRPRPRPEGSARTRPGGGPGVAGGWEVGGRGTSRPRGSPGRGRSRRRQEGGRAGPEEKPRRPGRWRRGREPLASLPRGHLGQAPRGPGQQGGRPECLSAGPDFSAQPSSRNARAAPAGQRPQLRIRGGARRGSRPSTAPTSRTTPGWFPPCPRPQFPSRWNRDQVRTGAIRASARPPSWSQLLEQPASLA